MTRPEAGLNLRRDPSWLSLFASSLSRNCLKVTLNSYSAKGLPHVGRKFICCRRSNISSKHVAHQGAHDISDVAKALHSFGSNLPTPCVRVNTFHCDTFFRGRPPFLAHLLRVFLSYFAARAFPPELASWRLTSCLSSSVIFTPQR